MKPAPRPPGPSGTATVLSRWTGRSSTQAVRLPAASAARSAGLFTRRTEIEELGRKIAVLTKERQAKLQAMDAAKAEVVRFTAEVTATESEAVTAGGDAIRAEAEQNRICATLAQQTDALQQLQQEEARLQAAIDTAHETAAQSRAQSEQLAAESTALEGELSALADGDDDFLATRSRMSDEMSECKLARLGLKKTCKAPRQPSACWWGRSGEAAKCIAALRESIAQLVEAITANEQKIQGVEQSRTDAAGRIAAEEAAIQHATDLRLEKRGPSPGKARGCANCPTSVKSSRVRLRASTSAALRWRPNTMPPRQSCGRNTS